jgi:plastocyanin
MAGRAFSPRAVTVNAGTVVRWRNNDGRDHTVTANDRSFDSGVMAVGATFVKTFNQAGTFGYLCAIHPDMTGTITVRPAPGATPPPATPPPAPTPVPTPRPAPVPGSGDVRAVDFAFNPATVDVIAGTTITWRNDGAALHTVTASDGSWDSGLINAGRTFARRFATPGTFPYLCALHPSMAGVVRVSGADGATPPPAPSTPRPTRPPVASGELELRDFAFVPSSIRVSPGTKVTWINTGAAPHTVTDRAGAFDSGLVARGARWSRTFASPGTYQLLCAIHPEMHATLTVAAPGATAPPPATPAPVATPAPGSGAVAILDFDYAPKTLSVAVGTTVRWTNQGVAPHTVTARDGSFDSGFLSTNDGFTRTFTRAATIEYLCSIHPAMIGTVVVGEGPAATPGGTADAAGPSSSPGASGPPGAPSPAAAGGGPAGGAGDGSGSGTGVTGDLGRGSAEAVSRPLTTDSILRLTLVALLCLVAVGVFVKVIAGVAPKPSR